MWKELIGFHNLENSDNMLKALAHLNANDVRPEEIKIVSTPIVKIYYYMRKLS